MEQLFAPLDTRGSSITLDFAFIRIELSLPDSSIGGEWRQCGFDTGPNVVQQPSRIPEKAQPKMVMRVRVADEEPPAGRALRDTFRCQLADHFTEQMIDCYRPGVEFDGEPLRPGGKPACRSFQRILRRPR